jgi:hypothetical protein
MFVGVQTQQLLVMIPEPLPAGRTGLRPCWSLMAIIMVSHLVTTDAALVS